MSRYLNDILDVEDAVSFDFVGKPRYSNGNTVVSFYVTINKDVDTVSDMLDRDVDDYDIINDILEEV